MTRYIWHWSVRITDAEGNVREVDRGVTAPTAAAARAEYAEIFPGRPGETVLVLSGPRNRGEFKVPGLIGRTDGGHPVYSQAEPPIGPPPQFVTAEGSQ